MVDDESGISIIHPRVLAQLRLDNEIVPRSITLTGFNNAVERTSGEITLPVLASDMPGIPNEIATHKLNVDPLYPVVRSGKTARKRLHQGVEVPQWVANVVMVKNKNGKWRIRVDFTYLNKACLKDPFPLPHIDQLIDATAGHELLSFLDAYSGYNQILIEEEDQEKTTFITHQGTYCYRVKPFELKMQGQPIRG
uniref:Uncharacterized protein LOC104239524 n=1 Tax=Nicotiana sylvestris TaxID=4096 RepID=A0A1U7XK91_NICSY|nr:PREDICTED: uncharacterized protein LOC104239524 [Nicotiana sylvestris]